MVRRNYDPLACVPPAMAVEENLKKAVETVRRLRILLKTARKIECSSVAIARKRREGASHA